MMDGNDHKSRHGLFERNMSIIKDRFPRLAFHLSQPCRGTDLTVAFMRNHAGEFVGSVTVRSVQYQFISDRDPRKHAERFVHEKFSDTAEGFVLCGLEAGYSATAFLDRMGSSQHLVVIEPDPVLFREQLRAIDLEKLLRDPRLTLIVDEKCEAVMHTLQVFLFNNGLDNITFAVIPVYAQLFSEFVRELKAAFLTLRERTTAMWEGFKTSSAHMRERCFNENGQMGSVKEFFRKIAAVGDERPLDLVEQSYLFAHMLMAHKAYSETTGVGQ